MDQEDPLEEVMAVYSNILPGIIPWTEESGRPQSMGSTKIELTEHAHKDKHFFD